MEKKIVLAFKCIWAHNDINSWLETKVVHDLVKSIMTLHFFVTINAHTYLDKLTTFH